MKLLRHPAALRTLTALAIAGAAAALVHAGGVERDQRIVFEDERHYLQGAAHLAQRGRLAFAPPEAVAAPAGLLREPGYPAALTLAWRAAGERGPATTAELEAMLTNPRLYRPIRILHLAGLALAAAASGWAVARLAGAPAGALAALLAAASPALARLGTEVMAENLALPLYACASAGLVALATGAGRRGLALLLPAAAGLPLVRAEALLLLPVAAFAAARALPLLPAASGAGRASRRGATRKGSAFLLFFLLLALPALGWMARNRALSGHWVLSDRGGLALAVRAELDADIALHGARAAALSWTPSERARSVARRLAPDATFLDYRPHDAENFLHRTYTRFARERERPGANPVEVDARLGREALVKMAERPGTHLIASLAVAWRGIFAERSPAWAQPFDLTLALALLLGVAFVALAARAVAHGERAHLALVLPALVVIAFHVAATEFLPRYTLPLLSILWSAAVTLGVLLVRGRPARVEGDA